MNVNSFGKGRARLALVNESLPPRLWQFDRPFSPNVFLYEAATILAQLLRRDPEGRTWHLSTLYLEFENNSGAAVSVPSPERDEGKTYFDSLSASPKRDYLRVPVLATALDSTDEDLYVGGNLLTFFGQTVGSTGVHGKEFSAAQQSRVYGAALVATPSTSDPSQDLVFSRLYYEAADQQIKSATTQVALEYQVPLS